MKKLSGSAYSLIFIIALMLGVIGLSTRLEYFASKLLPLVIGTIVLILSVIALIREIKGASNTKPESKGNNGAAGNRTIGARAYAPIAAWICGFVLSIYILGFMISTLLFVGAYMKKNGATWLATFVTAILFTGIFYLVFNVALQADLYRGELFLRL